MKKLVLLLLLFSNAAFAASSTLSNLPAASTLNGSELYYVVQNGTDRKATGTQIINQLFGPVGFNVVINGTTVLGGTPGSILFNNGGVVGNEAQIPVANGGTGQSIFTSGLPILGNGSSALQQGTLSGNTTNFITTSGILTNGHCAGFDASGNLVDEGGPCTVGGGGGTVTAGTAGQFAYYSTSAATVVGSSLSISSGTASTLFGADNTNASMWLTTRPVITLTGANESTVFGSSALNSLLTPSNLNAVTAYGALALRNLTSGTYITAIGSAAGGGLTSGDSFDVFIGTHSGLCASGTGSVAIGTSTFGGTSACTQTGINNTVAIGSNALTDIQTGAVNNTVIGSSAGGNLTTGHDNTGIGQGVISLSTTGNNNVAIGVVALANNNGSFNVAIGNSAGQNATGNSNVFIGANAGFSEVGNNKLHIDNGLGSGTPLIGGDFSARTLAFDGNAGTTFRGAHVAGTNFLTLVPTVTACGAGPGPSLVGTDMQGLITVGGGAVTGCTLNFGIAFNATPACVIASNTAITSPTVTNGLSTMVIGAGASISGDVISYVCIGT